MVHKLIILGGCGQIGIIQSWGTPPPTPSSLLHFGIEAAAILNLNRVALPTATSTTPSANAAVLTSVAMGKTGKTAAAGNVLAALWIGLPTLPILIVCIYSLSVMEKRTALMEMTRRIVSGDGLLHKDADPLSLVLNEEV